MMARKAAPPTADASMNEWTEAVTVARWLGAQADREGVPLRILRCACVLLGEVCESTLAREAAAAQAKTLALVDVRGMSMGPTR